MRAMRWTRPRLHAVLVFAVVAVAAPAAAQADLVPMWGKPKPWVAPGNLFSILVPLTWSIIVNDSDPTTFEFRPNAYPGGEAVLWVRRVRVPPGANPRQLLLNALEQRLRKLPSFREGARRDVKVAGSPAAVVAGTYYFQNNAQYPRAVEDLFVVKGEEAFVFHFDCFEPLGAELAGDMDGLYKSFVIRPPPSPDAGKPPPPGLGEIVNPDTLPY